ncbi:hypothetical protein GCM10011391_32820 [Pullulanibacillus camelliae]|uniref:Transcription factor zinc-finger domain-containing protein n=1 Tax=Pullulanibacillus camelliae TaxID=1707096 RepID=A0A8J2YLR0_9BACL|nr:zf-TFIIB domain-containing protein [Pullulanibacillus camelliae]GGE51466.1 hypothetical protein GCM10011391_32820 [Pullulanibacillus camelliae]
MNCPVCDDVRMKEVEKEGILVDICPSCKGVWLDRGELDKLLTEAQELRQPFNKWYNEAYQHKHQEPTKYKEAHAHKYHGDYKRKKPKSFLDRMGDIFD